MKQESEALGCQISKQTFFFLDLNNCIASPALFLLSNQPQMTLGRLSMVCFSPPPPCGAFSEHFPQRLGCWLLNRSFFLFVQVSNFIQFKFYSISGYKICKSGLERDRFWRAGNRLPPTQIKEARFRGEQGSQGRERRGAAGDHGAGMVRDQLQSTYILNETFCRHMEPIALPRAQFWGSSLKS